MTGESRKVERSGKTQRKRKLKQDSGTVGGKRTFISGIKER